MAQYSCLGNMKFPEEWTNFAILEISLNQKTPGSARPQGIKLPNSAVILLSLALPGVYCFRLNFNISKLIYCKCYLILPSREVYKPLFENFVNVSGGHFQPAPPHFLLHPCLNIANNFNFNIYMRATTRTVFKNKN